MDNDDAPVGIIYTRREALTIAARAGLAFTAGGLLTLAEAQTQKPKVDLIASPEMTEGPFFVDEKLNRSNLLGGTTRKSVLNGTPLELEILIHKLSKDKHTPLTNAQVDLWHCDAIGVYSDEDHPMNPEKTGKQTWLRGYQTTGEKGVVKFTTIVPGWYGGRTPHIHFKIRTFSPKMQATAEFTSQFFFTDEDIEKAYKKSPYKERGNPDTPNKRDEIYSERQVDGSAAGSHLLLDLKPKGEGFAAKFAVVLTDKNFHGGRRGFGGPGGPPPGGPGGGGWEAF